MNRGNDILIETTTHVKIELLTQAFHLSIPFFVYLFFNQNHSLYQVRQMDLCLHVKVKYKEEVYI